MPVRFVLKQIDYEPQGILHLSSALEAAGHETGLIVATCEDAVQSAMAFAPDVLACGVTTGAHRYYPELHRRIKQRVKAFSAYGGPHATLFLQMVEEAGVDGVCRDVSELAVVDLLDVRETEGPVAATPN